MPDRSCTGEGGQLVEGRYGGAYVGLGDRRRVIENPFDDHQRAWVRAAVRQATGPVDDQ